MQWIRTLARKSGVCRSLSPPAVGFLSSDGCSGIDGQEIQTAEEGWFHGACGSFAAGSSPASLACVPVLEGLRDAWHKLLRRTLGPARPGSGAGFTPIRGFTGPCGAGTTISASRKVRPLAPCGPSGWPSGWPLSSGLDPGDRLRLWQVAARLCAERLDVPLVGVDFSPTQLEHAGRFLAGLDGIETAPGAWRAPAVCRRCVRHGGDLGRDPAQPAHRRPRESAAKYSAWPAGLPPTTRKQAGATTASATTPRPGIAARVSSRPSRGRFRWTPTPPHRSSAWPSSSLANSR